MPSDMAQAAAEMMKGHGVGAIPVVSDSVNGASGVLASRMSGKRCKY